jgi:hypothetical protein
MYDTRSGAFEQSNLGDKMYDFAFSCPPYFTSELYSKDDEQSYNRYTSLVKWITGFLKPSLELVWRHLNTKGTFAVMLNDPWIRNADMTGYEPLRICQSLHEIVDALPGSEYVGTWGFKADEDKTSFQPLFVWTKNQI